MTTLPSSGELPEELVAEAREVWRAASGFDNIGTGDPVTVIARALMAERERAARIARRKIVGGYMHGSPEFVDGDVIADAILSDKEQSHAE